MTTKFEGAVIARITEAAKTEPLADWAAVRNLSYKGRYLWGSIQRFANAIEGAWLKAFKAQAPRYGAEIVVENGYVYVAFPQDMPNE